LNMPRGRTRKSGLRSGFEERIAKELDDAKVKYTYETKSFTYVEPLRKNLAHCGACGSTDLRRTGRYTPDFVLRSGLIIEAKGRFTAGDRRKMKAMKKQHPDVKIVMLFMRDNALSRKSKTFYSDWCMENDYDFSIGTLKQEWLK